MDIKEMETVKAKRIEGEKPDDPVNGQDKRCINAAQAPAAHGAGMPYWAGQVAVDGFVHL